MSAILRKRHPLMALMTAFLLLPLITACNNNGNNLPPATRFEGGIFGTFYQVTLVGDYPEQEAKELEQGFLDLLQQVDQQMSSYQPDSDINRLNNAQVGEWVTLPPALMDVLDQSRLFAEKTDGAFDVTVGGLVNLWSFGPEARPEGRPDEEELQKRLSQSGIDNLELDMDRQRARRLTDLNVNVSGIAKGFAVDAVADYLRARGIGNFMVNIGGDITAAGRRSPERPWQVGVEIPRDGEKQAQHVVPLDDQSLATSGDYRNYFQHDGRRYSHIINPRTGQPVRHRLASTSVFTPSNTEANALATSFMVMGTHESLAFAEKHDIPALLIERRGGEFRTHLSSAFEAMLDEPYLAPIKEASYQNSEGLLND
ncbi:MAG: FAD:protein FMN transferase [Oleiphilaceae bacterium]|nr:FAD:protein FMN transferase [Oleiphilaceae bacterium]